MAWREFYVDCIDDYGKSKEVAVELEIDDLEWKISVTQLFALKFYIDQHTLVYLVDNCFMDISVLEEQVEEELQEKYSRDAREKYFCTAYGLKEE